MKGIFKDSHKKCKDLPQRIATFRDLCRNLILDTRAINSKHIEESLLKLKCCDNCTHQCTECDDLSICEQKEKCSRTPCQYCGKLPRNCKNDEVETAIDILNKIGELEQREKDDGGNSHHNEVRKSQNAAICIPRRTNNVDRLYGKMNADINNVYKWEKQLEKLSEAFVTYCLFLHENEIITKLDLDDYFMEQRMIFRLPIQTLRSVYSTNHSTDEQAVVVNNNVVTPRNVMMKPVMANTTVMEFKNFNNYQKVAVVRQGKKNNSTGILLLVGLKKIFPNHHESPIFF